MHPEFEELDSQDAIASSVEHLVPLKDDPCTSAFTFRAVLLGCLFGLGLSAANAVWAFRTNASITTSGATFAVVASYPLGLLWHRIFPKHAFWNPGPFNVKEHVVIYVLTHASSVPYGMENVVSQAMPTLMNNKDITFFHALAFVIVTQFTGFGFAGLCRRFLVKPRAIIWPTTFSTLAIFASFHGIFGADSAIGSRASVSDPEKPKGSMVESESNSDDTTFDVVVEDETGVGVSGGSSLTADAIFLQASIPRGEGISVEQLQAPLKTYKTTRQQAFWYSFLGMYIYSFVPEFFFPVLQTISICTRSSFEGLKAGSMGAFNAVASTTNGVGLFGITLDWYYIQAGFLTTPWWAILCYGAGSVLLQWGAVILLYKSDTWGLNTIMSQDSINPILNTVKLFVGNASSVTHKLGAPVNPAFFYNATDNYNLNITAYQDVSPIHITSFFAVQYASSFLTIAAVLSHVGLWYGSTIRRQVKNALQQASDSVDSLDVHNKLMTAYWEPSDWMFLVFVVVMAAFTFCVSLFTPFVMPWWGVFLNLAVIGILIVPCGIIQGISGIGISISVLAEFLMGTLIPGQTVAVMAFKSLALNNLNQGILLVSGLKLGHYLHVPPVAIIGAQFLGTFINALAATSVTWVMMFHSGELLNASHGEWQYMVYQTFYSDGAIWGAIGPMRFFGVGSLYQGLLWCFLIGFLCPFGPWLINRYVHPSKLWKYVNFPLIFAFGGVGGFQNGIVCPLLVGFIFQVLAFKYYRHWYHTYNFVMASGFDIGLGIAVLSIAILGVANVEIPFNPLNPNLKNVPIDYYCYSGANFSDYDCSYYSFKNKSDPRAC
ncbi:OPT superfamily oligopeptide transporter [Rhizoclosmatium globosum]|uniref:OPT superfamily oligopeptide transporter n=1 Tax=Rhizoclosmatium globosum TaxID=329046 RepID=A0A1Y2CM03_9FUNG|nr:OPT superfamily oligopeptide transporter [Rhizoclosmatium globosum]|eukprot:ORY48040.1 OPT superfamily oligopeptide transporter [Rhizoclosmatium globosum]